MASIDHLERGRQASREHAWVSVFESLTSADRIGPLAPEDLRLLATSAYMLGRDDDYVSALERAHQGHLEAGDVPRAVRCGFWIGHSFLFRGERARGAGWFARAQRLLDGMDSQCVEHGYLRIPAWLEQMARGDFEAGYATAVEAADIGERFSDADLIWLARDDQARALIRLGRPDEALRLVDEALVAATAGDLSPIVTGIVYCNTIAFCSATYEIRHAREWVSALTGWCERQPEMVAHNGLCQVHRAEMSLISGRWDHALAEARRSAERFSRGALNQLATGRAFYCQAEVHRLRGDFDEAELAYRRASEHGYEPQPGLSLLRLAQGKAETAAAAIRRVVGETTAPLRRAPLLPAYVEIMLALGNEEVARAASHELDEIADRSGREALAAMAAGCRGALALAEGRAGDALTDLRVAFGIWDELQAPYEIARLRVRVGLACQALGDADSAVLETEAAMKTFEELGARTDQAQLDASARAGRPDERHGLSERERQVLRLVATGMSNREIGTELFISEHTVARHVQNIFVKLAVSSRAAATAFAFTHDLV